MLVINTLADLNGMKIGVQIATLADAIAMQYGDGRLANQVTHMPDWRVLLADLRANTIDATVVDLRAFDAWRLRHGSDDLIASGYRHSLGFNMGFVDLAANRALVDQVDGVLADLQQHHVITPMAANAGLTLLPQARPPSRLMFNFRPCKPTETHLNHL